MIFLIYGRKDWGNWRNQYQTLTFIVLIIGRLQAIITLLYYKLTCFTTWHEKLYTVKHIWQIVTVTIKTFEAVKELSPNFVTHYIL